ncbi:MAG: hypothetical protein QM537_07890 [Candidatus Symbiobacter sp.]|nr:hypothetical protein [Candidatus Symbiobacter sp.]
MSAAHAALIVMLCGLVLSSLVLSSLGLSIGGAFTAVLAASPGTATGNEKSVFLLDPPTEPAQPPAKPTAPPARKTASPAPVAKILVKIPFADHYETWDRIAYLTEIDAIIAKMQKNSSLRLAIYSYASGKSTRTNQYHRLALNRAWSIAEYVTAQNIGKTRVTLFPVFQASDQVNPAGSEDMTDRVELKWLK